jgi:hypothetical protein
MPCRCTELNSSKWQFSNGRPSLPWKKYYLNWKQSENTGCMQKILSWDESKSMHAVPSIPFSFPHFSTRWISSQRMRASRAWCWLADSLTRGEDGDNRRMDKEQLDRNAQILCCWNGVCNGVSSHGERSFLSHLMPTPECSVID